MNYKETLFFIGKCLTISLEEKNRLEVEKVLQEGTVNWDTIVKVSTAHYVFPALYCNLRRTNFLQYLPRDLVEYMKHITNLNYERNQQIIEQAKEINQLLIDNNFTPIFLKGTGNLLEGLYEDIAERMVGDIDFLVSKDEYLKTVKILKDFGYSKVHKNKYDPISFKHYPELSKENRIAAVEVHKNILIEEYASEFNYNLVIQKTQQIKGITFLDFDNQLNLSILAKQINDDGYYFKNISLRNAYDVFLQSKKTVAKNAFRNLNTLKNPVNCFLAICYEVFNKPESLEYEKTREALAYVNTFYLNLSDEKKYSNYNKILRKLFIRKRLNIIYKSFFNSEYRNWLIKRTADKKWQHEKLIQLGLKKPKPNS